MKKFEEYIGLQFGNPRGLIGKFCCFVMNRMNAAMYQSVITNIKADSGSTLLEVGYGNGYLIKQLTRKTGATIYGIELSEDMRKAAGKRNQKAVAENKVFLTIGDCCALNFADNQFDGVTSVNTIYFWTDPIKGLSEIRRTLKKGGVFYNAVYSKEWLQKLPYTQYGFRHFEKSDYMKMARKAGFSKVTVTEIAAGKNMLIQAVK